jgi:two-component sensor histidine kinase
LTKRLPQFADLSPEAIPHHVDAIGGTVDELVRNVQEHAAGPERPDPNCLLRISLESEGEIRCSILDTGVGLSYSLCSKKEKIEPELTAEDRIAKLISNEIPDWDAGRGTGLAFAAELITELDGSFTVANDVVRVRRTKAKAEARADGFPLKGTVIDITVPTVSS